MVLVAGLAAAQSPGRYHWTEVSAEAGIEFRHTNGASDQFFFVETYGSGAAFGDYDGDGRMDLYLVNGAPLPGYVAQERPRNRLFRNQGDGRFADFTQGSGAGHEGYGMGVAAGDYDNDGWLDLYVTNWGPNALLRNGGHGSFADVTQAAGVGDPHLGTSAAFADWDLDGDLDLYAANYAHFDPAENKECFQGGVRVYCGPLSHRGVSGVLYRNEGSGTFTEVTRQAGVYSEEGRQLGVAFADFDLDGDPDLHVANDATPNFLFRNDGARFSEVALLAGIAFNEDGQPEAGMGTDWGDYDLDGDPDLVVTNYQWEVNRLYRNEGGEFFADRTAAAGLAETTLAFLGFGVNFFDFDNDGFLDLYVANGHVDGNVNQYDPGARYAQRALLFHNQGDSSFQEVGALAGPGLAVELVGRGSAVADYDDDGDLDLCVTSNGGQAVLLRNDGRQGGNWLQVRTVGTRSNRSGIGARLVLEAGGRKQAGEVRSGSSYLSQSDLGVHFGLGSQAQVDRLTIYWPSGARQILREVPANQRLVVVERAGQ
jgi:hypothetical protein